MPDFDDILWDNIKNETIEFSSDMYFRPSRKFKSEQFELEQALISKKERSNGYSVERVFVNSKQYRDKFSKLPVNTTVQQALYIQAGRLLEEVDGQEQERMLAVNARTGKFIVDNFERNGSITGTGFNDQEYQKIIECTDSIALIHNHSLNGRPSIQDLLTYLHDNQIRISIIACHDGTLYSILDVKPETELIYNEILNQTKTLTSNKDEAKRLATTILYQTNDQLDDKHKFFKIEKL